MSKVTDLIPHRPPFLFVDEIVSRSEDGLVARRTWRPDEDFYRGHYPGAPITPGVLLCEAVFQTGALFLAGQLSGDAPESGVKPDPHRGALFLAGQLSGDAPESGVKPDPHRGALLLAGQLSGGGTKEGIPLLARVSDVRFRNPVYPGDTITIQVKRTDSVGGFVMMRGSVTCGEKRILNVDFTVAWKTPAGGGPAS